jgi:hypothetical protein
MNFEVTQNGLTMKCRLLQRRGGPASGSWVLSGYVDNKERMSCDVTATVCRYHGIRMIEELMATASQRLRQIASE